jgi:hypothetical protein
VPRPRLAGLGEGELPDYGDFDEPTDADALTAIADATHVVEAVDHWLTNRPQGG